MSIRIVVADDQPVVRVGFAALLGAQDGLEVVGEAADGQAAVDVVVRERPDVVVMDVRMPVLDGIEAARRVVAATQGQTRVLVVTTFDLDAYVYDALRAGASGFLLKDATAAELTAAVRSVASGDSLASPLLTRRLVADLAARNGRRRSVDVGSVLTSRERQVMLLVAHGQSNREIAQGLGIGEETVKTHVARCLAKLGLRDRVQLVVFAYECGLVVPGQASETGAATVEP